MDKEEKCLVMTAIITVIVFVGCLVWLCGMGIKYPELTKQKCYYCKPNPEYHTGCIGVHVLRDSYVGVHMFSE